jgi:hypothetical protein
MSTRRSPTVDRDIRIEHQKLHHHRRQEARQRGVRMKPQNALRLRLLRAGQQVSLLQFRQDRAQAIVIRLANLGQADLAGGTVQQPGAEALLQGLDVVADRGDGHIQAASRGGKSTGFHDTPKDREAGQTVHAGPIINCEWIILPPIDPLSQG